VVPAGTYHNVVEDGDAEVLYDLLSAEPSGWDSAQNQSRGNGCGIGGTPLKRKVFPVKEARAVDNRDAPERQWRPGSRLLQSGDFAQNRIV
jgi:hypothetical protein